MKKEVVKDIDRLIKLNEDYYTAYITCYDSDDNEVIDKTYLKISNKCLKTFLTNVNEIVFNKYGRTFAFSDSDILTMNFSDSYVNGVHRVEFQVGYDLEPYKIKEEQEDGDDILRELFNAFEFEIESHSDKSPHLNFSIHKSDRYKDNSKLMADKINFFN